MLARVGAHARRQPAATRRRCVAQRRRTRRRADAPHSGAADADAGADDAGARARRDDRRPCTIDGDDAARRDCRRRTSRRAAVDAHPLAQVHQAAVDAARAQEDVLARTDLPRVYLAVERVRARQRRESERQLDGGVGRPRSRPRELGGRRAGRVSERVRLLEPARAQGGGGGVDARRDRAATTRRC